MDFLAAIALDAAAYWASQPEAGSGGKLHALFDLNDVIERTSRLITEDHTNLRARFLRGAAYQSQQRYPEALADLDAVLDQEPNHHQALLLRSEIHFALGNVEQGQADSIQAESLGSAIQAKPQGIRPPKQ